MVNRRRYSLSHTCSQSAENSPRLRNRLFTKQLIVNACAFLPPTVAHELFQVNTLRLPPGVVHILVFGGV